MKNLKYIISLLSLLLFTNCNNDNNSNQSMLDTRAMTGGSQENQVDSVDLCSLLSKAEVEKLVGKPVLEPESEQYANVSTCTFGDPEYPGVSVIASISVIISSNQKESMEILEMTRKNAASVEIINNLGDDAFFDKILRTLWIIKNKYEIGIEVDSDVGGLETSKKIATIILERLP